MKNHLAGSEFDLLDAITLYPEHESIIDLCEKMNLGYTNAHYAKSKLLDREMIEEEGLGGEDGKRMRITKKGIKALNEAEIQEYRSWKDKNREDLEKFYSKNYKGMSRKEVARTDPGFYKLLCRRGWRDIIPLKNGTKECD